MTVSKPTGPMASTIGLVQVTRLYVTLLRAIRKFTTDGQATCKMRYLPGKAIVVLANGYILFFFSERVFWCFWRPGDNVREFLLTWFVYCLLGWIFLLVVRRYLIASFPPRFLAGAVFGWVGEGKVAIR